MRHFGLSYGVASSAKYGPAIDDDGLGVCEKLAILVTTMAGWRRREGLLLVRLRSVADGPGSAD